jgi:ribosomal protein L9
MSRTRQEQAAEAVEKNRAIHQAIEGALQNLEAHAGEEGYRHLYDRALHIISALKRAGFNFVRNSPRPGTEH